MGILSSLMCALALSCGAPAPAPGTPPGPPPSGVTPAFGYADGSFYDVPPGAGEASVAAARAREGGAAVVRVLVRWAYVQPLSASDWDWSTVDAYIQALDAAGIRPLLVVTTSPGWAQDPADRCTTILCPPAASRLPAFATFVEQLARRYAGADPAGIEIWNEPNLTVDWKTATGPDPKRYTALLKAGASASRKVDSKLPVILGGLASGLDGFYKYSSTTFLNVVYANGGKGSFDAIGLHPYPQPDERNPFPSTWQLDFALYQARYARDVNNDRGRAIWITETGFSTGMPARGDWPAVSGTATEGTQGQGILAWYDRAAQFSDVKAFLVWRLRDDAASPYETGWGVLHGDWSPKPAFCELHERFAPAVTGGACS
jgi:hypothetical protein